MTPNRDSDHPSEEHGDDVPLDDRARLTLTAALADSVAPEAPPALLKERLLASVSRAGRFGIFADRLARLFDLPLATIMKLLAKLDDERAWTDGPAEGTAWIGVRAGPKYANAMAAFGRLRPGSRFPRHRHVGDETTLVLAGGFRDSTGVEVERGEELHAASGTAHDFVVLDGEECIAAVIAVDGVELE